MQASNPRLFDGPILSVVSLESGSDDVGAIRVRRGSYAMLAVQNPQIPEHVETGTDQLSVTAVVLSRDSAGKERILLGRRGMSTRLYGGMWELGPSGGVDAPAADTPLPRLITPADLARQVHEECREEMEGLALHVESMPAITYDPVARSYDVVCLCRADVVQDVSTANWEYEGSRWVPLDEIAAFDRGHEVSIIAPTRALFRFFGWV